MIVTKILIFVISTFFFLFVLSGCAELLYQGVDNIRCNEWCKDKPDRHQCFDRCVSEGVRSRSEAEEKARSQEIQARWDVEDKIRLEREAEERPRNREIKARSEADGQRQEIALTIETALFRGLSSTTLFHFLSPSSSNPLPLYPIYQMHFGG